MNIHEYQAKNILKEFGVPVPNGIVILNKDEIENKAKKLNSKNLAIKAQIHAGGRGKAGGIKLVNNYKDLIEESNKLFDKILVTNQTGKQGKKVKRIYLEEISNIKREFYLSCLVDRSSSKIAFISSAEGGVDIEKVAKNNPEKIITIKMNLSKSVSEENIKKIIQPFALRKKSKKQTFDLVQSIYKILIEKVASLIEINPLILTEDDNILCLDAKINFDDNALYRHPDILSLKDPNEEDPTETEAKKH